jgi:hypothetical protein
MEISGYVEIVTDGSTREYDTFTCCHCSKIVLVKKKEMNFGFCTLCFKPICKICEDVGSCTPFEKKLERIEKEAYHARNRGY